MRMTFIAVSCVIGCQAPAVSIEPRDAGDDAFIDAVVDSGDAKTCAPVRTIDGGVCNPKIDEDLDCIPDECDDCPNVPQDPVVTARPTNVAGEACTAPHFAKTTSRKIFQGFSVGNAKWVDLGKNSLGDEAFRIHDGAGFLGSEMPAEQFRVAYVDLGLGGSDVVATGVLRFVAPGPAGLALRVATEGPTTSYLCALVHDSVGTAITRFGLFTTQCAPTCGLTPLRDAATGTPQVKALPANVGASPDEVLLRAAASTTADGVELECQVFPVPRAPSDVDTLLASKSEATVSATVTDPTYPSGEVGFFVLGATRVALESLDVLVR